MTPTQSTTLAILIDGLWSGEISQREFEEVGESAGIPAERLNEVMREIRDEDGTWGM